MAEGFLRSFDLRNEIISAGTKPEKQVNPHAVKVMKEVGIDISEHLTKHVDKFVSESFDHVITVCDNARESCPFFTGKVGNRVHIGFVDPADARGTEEEVMAEYRRVRDQIRAEFERFYKTL
jgi:arsenate reductase